MLYTADCQLTSYAVAPVSALSCSLPVVFNLCRFYMQANGIRLPSHIHAHERVRVRQLRL